MRSSLLKIVSVFFALPALSQVHTLAGDLQWLTDTPAVSGYEGALTDRLMQQLKAYKPQRDNMGNVTVTFGSGAPHRLLVASVDEPGYVVSEIQPDGYMRMQRMPAAGLPKYNEMQNAQQMVVGTRDGRLLPAVISGLSIHLTPGRINVPDPDHLDNLYLDMGAATSADVQHSGVDVLSPVAAERSLLRVGAHGYAGTAVGDRFGAAVLLQLVQAVAAAPQAGTTTIAFATQQWYGTRGLTRLMQQTHPDEVVYVGRSRKPAARADDAAGTPALLPGAGVVAYGTTDAAWLGAPMKKAGAAPFLLRLNGPAIVPPTKTAHIGIASVYPTTAGEMIDDRDLNALMQVLAKYLGVAAPAQQPVDAVAMAYVAQPRPTSKPDVAAVLKALTLSYGVSEVEAMSRAAVANQLPPWAKTTTDASGNLILQFGSGAAGGTVIMAHTDELGFRVKSIDADGMLQLDNKGGGSPAFYWGHPALVHTTAGMRGAVVDLPENYDTAQFKFPADFRIAARLNIGAGSAAEVAAQGIQVGDTVTIVKKFHTLVGHRVSIRSLDDRVGCAAMVDAVWALGKDFNRNVTFVWSTQEELGLLGATAYAEAADKAGKSPETVFAIDTFVSSDAPNESSRFADGKLGAGFVVRALDSTNLVPWAAVQRVQSIAAAHKVPMQYGVTGGSNDGAAFNRYGSMDVALSWPMRYSHSPAEVMDLRDLEALATIAATLAREW